MSTNILEYGAVRTPPPRLLAALPWLDYACAACAVLLFGAGIFAQTAIKKLAMNRGANPSSDSDRMILTFVAYGIVFSTIAISNARWIRRRTHRKWTRALSLFLTLFIPIGTVVGLITFVVLGKPAIKQVYDVSATASRG